MTYKRVTEEERRLINNWCQVGESLREMGRRLQRAASSISREIKRNKGGRGYRAKQAHEKAQARGRREGPRRFTAEVKEDVILPRKRVKGFVKEKPENGRNAKQVCAAI